MKMNEKITRVIGKILEICSGNIFESKKVIAVNGNSIVNGKYLPEVKLSFQVNSLFDS